MRLKKNWFAEGPDLIEEEQTDRTEGKRRNTGREPRWAYVTAIRKFDIDVLKTIMYRINGKSEVSFLIHQPIIRSLETILITFDTYQQTHQQRKGHIT